MSSFVRFHNMISVGGFISIIVLTIFSCLLIAFLTHLKSHAEVSLTDEGLTHAEVNTLVVDLFAYACDVFGLVSIRIF